MDRVGSFLLWFLPAALVSVGIARVSVWIQPLFSPLVIYPLLVGAAIGAASAGLMYLTHIRNYWSAILGAAILGIIAGAAEHAFYYLDYRAGFELARSSQQALGALAAEQLEPASFAYYMRRQAESGSRQVFLWAAHVLFMATGAAAFVAWHLRSRQTGATASNLTTDSPHD